MHFIPRGTNGNGRPNGSRSTVSPARRPICCCYQTAGFIVVVVPDMNRAARVARNNHHRRSRMHGPAVPIADGPSARAFSSYRCLPANSYVARRRRCSGDRAGTIPLQGAQETTTTAAHAVYRPPQQCHRRVRRATYFTGTWRDGPN
jgi:hypothetical protein